MLSNKDISILSVGTGKSKGSKPSRFDQLSTLRFFVDNSTETEQTHSQIALMKLNYYFRMQSPDCEFDLDETRDAQLREMSRVEDFIPEMSKIMTGICFAR